jgi:hypothetical protein
VPDPFNPPVVVPSTVLEPIGKKYVLTAELSGNSLEADNLCFQVNSLEEIRVHDPTQDHTAGSSSSTGVSTVIEDTIINNQSTPPPSDKEAVGTPEDNPISSLGNKVCIIQLYINWYIGLDIHLNINLPIFRQRALPQEKNVRLLLHCAQMQKKGK